MGRITIEIFFTQIKYKMSNAVLSQLAKLKASKSIEYINVLWPFAVDNHYHLMV